jgi:hypothetical protein
MSKDASWNALVREICQALARRDAIDCRGERDPESLEACRQRRFWEAQARQGLISLRELAETASQPALARETLEELEEWAFRERVPAPV